MAAGIDSAEAQIEPSNSRAPNPFSESTYERPLGYRELANPKPVICSFPQQIIDHDAESLTCTIDELQDQRIFMDKEISLSDKFVAKLSLQIAGSESDVINDLSRTLSESEKCGVEFQECLTENGAKRALMGEEVIRSEEFGYRVNSNGIPGQVAKHEESYFNILGHNQEANGEKEGSMIRKMSKSDEIGAQSPQYPRTKICKKTESLYLQTEEVEEGSGKSPWSVGDLSDQKLHSDVCPQEDKYFYYDAPFYGETGAWIPVSVPPMSESEHEEWSRGFGLSGGYLPDGDMSWSQLMGEDKEMTLWDVVLEMLLVARGKVNAYTSGDFDATAWMSRQLMEHAWREMSNTLTEANVDKMQKLLEAEPPKWLPDSTASSCMLCSLRFHPILCTRHHCRLCGGLFCGECSQGRSLLPEKFRIADPQRVCDVCSVRLQSVQPYLMDHVSRAAQLPTHDLTDLSTLRSWVNFPWGQSMEYEIYKAANTIRGYTKVGSLAHEKKIPEAILRDAKGLAIVTVVKVGMMVTYNIGTGLVVARREDGSWSPPSAISSFGLGWGAQVGGQLTDFIIVLRTSDAVKTFSCDTHLSIGAGVSAAFGIIGRTAEADLRAGVGGCAACFTYSCSKGAFAGCSLEGSIVTTRERENSRFYGSEKLNAYDILLGSLARPPAAATLYRALGYLYQKF